MRQTAQGRRGDGLASRFTWSTRRIHEAIGTDRTLEHNPGPAAFHDAEEPAVEPTAFGKRVENGDVDAGIAHALDALTGHHGVGVDHADHATGDARIDERIGTGWGAAMVAAGLEGHISRSAAGVLVGRKRLKGNGLGMGSADGGMPTGREHAAIADQNTADARIGRCANLAPTRQREGRGHPFPVPGVTSDMIQSRCLARAAVRVLRSRLTMVIGPTPPGTGVIQLHFGATSA